MAEIKAKATGSPYGKVSLGADPGGLPAVGIGGNTTPSRNPDVGLGGGVVLGNGRRGN